MSDQMTHWERVRAALKGDALDRTPMSLWRHFYGQEATANGMAEAMLAFQNQFDWDFMKVNPRASYHSEDWGVRVKFSDSDSRGHEVVDWPIKKPADWEAVLPLNIHGGALGEHLGALDHIAKELGGELPLLMTVFTPLSVAAQLAGSSEALQGFLAEHPASVHHALEAITQTFAEFAAGCLKAGADGLFFATNGWATYDGLTDEEYAEFGRPYDLRLLEAVPDAEFHVLHVCGSNNMLSDLADYPVAAFNWDAQDDTNIWLLEGLKTTGRTVIGGVPQRGDLLEGSPEEVAEEARWTLSAMAGTRWMLGPGCTISPESPEANIRALRDSYRG